VYYIYTEASSHSNEHFILDLSTVFAEAKVLELWYHMYGSAMGTLMVEMATVDSTGTTGTDWVQVWSVSGEQQTSMDAVWRRVLVSIEPSVMSAVRVHAITGVDYQSDIAIDSISVHAPLRGCTGLMVPAVVAGGTLGTCSNATTANGTLQHDTQCTMACGNGSVLPVSCWNGTLHQSSVCCDIGVGAWWNGDTLGGCEACAAGQYDDDASVLTACVD